MTFDPQYPIGKATDIPSDDPEAEVARHRARFFATEQPIDDEQDPEAEVAGHAAKRPLMEQPGDDPEADAEVEGHYVRRGGAVEQPSDDPEAEVEGHGYRQGVTEQPVDADTDAAPGDPESLYKKY